MSVQSAHGMPQIDPTMMTSPRQRVPDLQRSDINQMSSGQLAKALGVIPEDRDAWNKLMRDINRSREWSEIPSTNSDLLRSVMGEVLNTDLGRKYFPTHNIHQNYYELLRKTLYWKQVRLDYPTPKGNQSQANLTASGKRRGRPPKYVVEERQQAAAAAAGQPTSLQAQQAQQQQQVVAAAAQAQVAQHVQQETPTMQQGKKRKRETALINEQLTQNHSSHALAESPLLDYSSAAALNRDRFNIPPTPTQYYRIRVISAEGKITRHAFPHDQNFVDVLEEIASTRGWPGDAVELLVQDPTSGEEFRLTSDNQESEWRYAALTPDASFSLVHKFSSGLNSVGIYPDRLTTGALASHHTGQRDR